MQPLRNTWMQTFLTHTFSLFHIIPFQHFLSSSPLVLSTQDAPAQWEFLCSWNILQLLTIFEETTKRDLFPKFSYITISLVSFTPFLLFAGLDHEPNLQSYKIFLQCGDFYLFSLLLLLLMAVFLPLSSQHVSWSICILFFANFYAIDMTKPRKKIMKEMSYRTTPLWKIPLDLEF